MNNRQITRTCLAGLGLLAALPATADHHEFSLVFLPDTQSYTTLRPEIFKSQVDWVVDNRDVSRENIIHVSQLGDLKDVGKCTNLRIRLPTDATDTTNTPMDDWEWEVLTEWQIVKKGFDRIQNVGIPYGVVPGNHDFDQFNPGSRCPNYTTERQLSLYNAQFVPGNFPASFYGGSRDNTLISNEDNFTLASSNGFDFIFINLAFRGGGNPSDTTDPVSGAPIDNSPEMTWAKNTLDLYPNHIAIVTSHYILDCNPTPNSGLSVDTSCSTATAANGNIDQLNALSDWGAQLYDRLKDNSNLFMMISGHRFGEAYRVENRTGMNPVHFVLANYQHLNYPFSASQTPQNDPIRTQASTFSNVRVAGADAGFSGFFQVMRFDVDSMTADLVAISPETDSIGPWDPGSDAGEAYRGVQGTPARFELVSARDVNVSAPSSLSTRTISNFRGFSFAGYAQQSQPSFVPVPGAFYRLTTSEQPTDRCLESNEFLPGNTLGGYPFIDGCGNFSGQFWRFVDQGNGYHLLQSSFLISQNQCLFEGDSNGAYMATCDGSSTQEWKILSTATEGSFRLTSRAQETSNNCLDGNVLGQAPSNGAIFMGVCDEANPGQTWTARQ